MCSASESVSTLPGGVGRFGFLLLPGGPVAAEFEASPPGPGGVGKVKVGALLEPEGFGGVGGLALELKLGSLLLADPGVVGVLGIVVTGGVEVLELALPVAPAGEAEEPGGVEAGEPRSFISTGI